MSKGDSAMRRIEQGSKIMLCHGPWLQAAVLLCVMVCCAHGGPESGPGWAPPSRASPRPSRASRERAMRLRGGVSKFYNVTAPPKRGGVFIQPEGGVVQVTRAARGVCDMRQLLARECVVIQSDRKSGRRAVRME